MLTQVRIVLVRPYHPGNIGSAARVMKNMGLNDLVLVNPVDFPSAEATRLAAGATDLLESCSVCTSLYEAIQDCHLVIASSARPRGFDLPELNPQQCAEQVVECVNSNPSGVKDDSKTLIKNGSAGERDQQCRAALIFGPERMGLANDEILLARYRVTIPANPLYPSLNLASAVQILCYELYKLEDEQHSGRESEKPGDEDSIHLSDQRLLPATSEMERFYDELEITLKETGFIVRQHPGDIMKKLRRLFSKAQPDQSEMNILRGILASIQRKK